MQMIIQTYLAFMLLISNPDSALVEAEKAYYNEDWKQLEEISSELIYNGYEDYQIYFYKTISLCKQSKQDYAHNFLNNLKGYNKLEEWKIYYLIAIVYENEDNKDDFVSYLNKAANLNPQFADAYNELGYYFYQKGEYYNALAYFKKAYQIEEYEIVYLHNLSITYNKLKKNNTALFYVEKILDIDPTFLAAIELKADLLMDQKHYSNALIHYELLKSYLPTSAEAHLKTGFCLSQLGNHELSCKNFEIAEKNGNLLAEDLLSHYCK